MLNEYRDILKSHDLSVTPVRIAVLQALKNHPHADVETIFSVVSESIATTSKQAIYNNLHTLVEHKLVREIKPKGQPSLYEFGTGDNHHHLVCRTCDKVMDTHCIASAPCLEPTDDHGFAVDEAEVIFWGICPACQSTRNVKGEKNG